MFLRMVGEYDHRCSLTLPSIFTHFNTEEKKNFWKENTVEKGEIAQNEQFHLLPQCFSMQSVCQNPLMTKFQLSSVASLNLGRSQNGLLGNGLNCTEHDVLAEPAFCYI